MRIGTPGILDVVLGALGLAVFLYGDLAADRGLRIAGSVVVTVCVVVAAILAAFRADDS